MEKFIRKKVVVSGLPTPPQPARSRRHGLALTPAALRLLRLLGALLAAEAAQGEARVKSLLQLALVEASVLPRSSSSRHGRSNWPCSCAWMPCMTKRCS